VSFPSEYALLPPPPLAEPSPRTRGILRPYEPGAEELEWIGVGELFRSII